MKKLVMIISSICLYKVAVADVSSAMNDFYSNISYAGNDPSIVHTQSANIVSFGGFSTRSKSTTLQPFSFTPPSFNASCGNMNFYAGAWAYLSNTDQLMEFLQNTLIAAAPLIFINALKAISPSLAGSIQSFFDVAQKILDLASNSCKLGTYLGSMSGTYAGKSLAGVTTVSQAEGQDASGALVNNTISGGARNLAQGIDKFNNMLDSWADNANAVLNPDVSGDKYGLTKLEMANTYGSIIWKGIQQLTMVNCTGCSMPSSMTSMANLIISLTGDVVITVPKDYNTNKSIIGTKPVSYPALMDVKTFYEGMPSDQAVYSCTSFNNNNPVECNGFKATLPTSTMRGGFKEQVETMITHVQRSLEDNIPLSQDDLKLIAISPIPIFQIAQACADAGLTSQIQTLLDGYTNEIAFSLTQAMVGEAMRLASAALATRNVKDDNVKLSVQVLADHIKLIQEQLRTDSEKYMKHNLVEVLQQADYLRKMAQNQYSPSLLQKIQFAKSFNNH